MQREVHTVLWDLVELQSVRTTTNSVVICKGNQRITICIFNETNSYWFDLVKFVVKLRPKKHSLESLRVVWNLAHL